MKKDERPVEVRFWERVKKSTGCWEWIGSMDSYGYGQLWVRQRRRLELAHRLAWELMVGPLPPGMSVLHRCDNRACVNATHLFLGKQTDNIADMVKKGRQRGVVGDRHPNAKLNDGKVSRIRERLSCGDRQAAIARDFGVSAGAIGAIARRKTWAHL